MSRKRIQQVHKKCGGALGIARFGQDWEFFCTTCATGWGGTYMPKLPADFVNVKDGFLLKAPSPEEPTSH